MSPLQPGDKRLLPNPFGRIVGHPLDDAELDVPEINRKAFDSCRKLIAGVRESHESATMTLLGEPGTGKTHLLGRVRKTLDHAAGDLFVFAPMATNARTVWRHLRRAVADALLRPGVSVLRPIDELVQRAESRLATLPERDLVIVLEALAKGEHARDAAAWLRGQDLPEEALAPLRLSPPGPEENQEDASRDVVAALCALLEPGVAVFCLDQWEALQSYPGDSTGIHAAGQAVWYLNDTIRNAAVICCVQTTFVPDLEKALPKPVQDRMLTRRDYLRPLGWDQAQLLVNARLAPHWSKWPFEAAALQQVFVDGFAPARKVITRCKDLYDQWRSGPVARETLDDALQRMFEERVAPATATEADAAMRDGLPLLLRTQHIAFEIPGKRSPFDLEMKPSGALASLCNHVHAKSLHDRLKKIDETWNPATNPNLILLRDARLPIGRNAAKTRERIEAIEKKGGRFVLVSQEAIEALAALRHLLADAQSGDLAHSGDAVAPAKVEDWIAGHLPASLDSLLGDLGLGGGAKSQDKSDILRSRLADLLAERKVVSLLDASRELQARPEEVESCARRDPGLFGVLGGPSPALFQPVRTD